MASNVESKGRSKADSLILSHKSTSDIRSSNSDAGSGSDDESMSSGSDEITPEYLSGLLAKAKANMIRKASAAATVEGVEGFDADEIRLNIEDDDKESENLPPLDPGKIPQPYFALGKTRRDVPFMVRDIDVERAEQASSSLAVPAPPLPPLELSKDGKPLTKKERKALKNKTAGPGWFDLPAPDAADLPRLYREVEALRLRNQLDPKRFYRKEEGEGKGIKGLPKHFAIGTIIPTSMPFGTASSDNLTRAERKRTIVDELIDDAESRSFAKRKFNDLQDVRAAKGRGTLAKKRALRKPKW